MMRLGRYALLIAALAALCLSSCDRPLPREFAEFTPFVYEAPSPEPAAGCYRNPVLPGFYPDPSVCRVGDDYWMVNSTFGYFPGIPVWHSTDLIHWEQCGSILESNDSFFVGNNNLIVGTFAPQISYNPANGLYYVICTFVGGYRNFFVSSPDPAGGQWSEPVTLPEVPGIDPSILFDSDGRAWIAGACGLDAIGETKLYGQDNAIVLFEFDWKNGCTVGPRRVIARHGVHPEDQPAALEGPHIYHIGDKYFLMCAEGGTEAGHSEVVFVADAVTGPYKPCAVNPILTQRDLPAEGEDFVNCTGHADLVQSAAGQWYAVFLGCQPYEGDHSFNTGRQTFLLPVQWVDGQPIILPAGERVPLDVPMNDDLAALSAASKIRGFNGYRPGPLWSAEEGLAGFTLFIRNPVAGVLEDGMSPKENFVFGESRFRGPFWEIDGKGLLRLTPKAVSVRSMGNPAAVVQRITAKTFIASTTLRFEPVADSLGRVSRAGIMCFQGENDHMVFAKTLDSRGHTILRLEEVRGGKMKACHERRLTQSEAAKALTLRVEAVTAVDYVFSYSTDGKHFTQVGVPLDGRSLRSPDFWGFEGAVTGIFASFEKDQ